MEKTYKFFREETQKWEVFPAGYWQWEAQYHDGTVLKQYDDSGIYHQVKEIDRTHPLKFKVFSLHENRVFIVLVQKFHKEIIFFQRAHAIGNPKNVDGKILYFGYSLKCWGATINALTVITPNGEVIITDDREAVTF